jgi:hypothetical protein
VRRARAHGAQGLTLGARPRPGTGPRGVRGEPEEVCAEFLTHGGVRAGTDLLR